MREKKKSILMVNRTSIGGGDGVQQNWDEETEDFDHYYGKF
jgi:hypothetical protein